MNKLMTAATLALTLGAYVNAAECGDPEIPVAGPCALWYDVSINVKTTKAVSKKIKVVCDDPYQECFRVQASKGFKGILVSCDCDCEDFMGAQFHLWNAKEKLFYVKGETLAWNPLLRIGKPNNKGVANVVESGWAVEGAGASFSAQGFGKWNGWRVQNISGNLIGALCPPVCLVSCDDPMEAVVFDCEMNIASSDFTIAYGSWNFKYNAKKSAALAKSQIVVLPNYATIACD